MSLSTLRQLTKNPGFAASAVLTLTLSIAANTTIFSLLYSAILRPLPYKDPGRLVVLWSSIPGKGIPADWTSWPTIQDWRARSASFEDVATELRIDSATLTGRTELEQVKVGRVSANFFAVMGVSPLLGRAFTEQEENRRDAVVLISYSFWQRQFGGAASIIGRRIEVDHKRATVVGVMPSAFAFPSADTELWLPVSFVPQWSAFLSARQSDGFRAIARLKPEVNFKQAQSELNLIARRLGEQHPNTDAGKGILLVPLARQVTDPRIRTALGTLSAAVLLVLLIGCSNVASLLLARGAARSKEFAIRAALGAARSRLIAQIMWESLVLAVISGLLGLVATDLLRHALPLIVPPDLAAFSHGELNVPVLIFTLLLSVATSLLFGFVPAWRLSFAEPQAALRGSSRGGGTEIKTGTRSALIVGEFALAVILLSGTGLLVRSFLLLQSQNLGFTQTKLLLGTVNLPMAESSQAERRSIEVESVLALAGQVPGVAKTAAISGLLSDYTPNTDVVTETSQVSPRSIQTVPSSRAIVSSYFFETMGISIQRGRSFSEEDRSSHPPVAVINSSMVHQFWPGQNAIGKRFRYGSPGSVEREWVTVIGVAGDMNPYGPGSRVIPTFYLPYSQVAGPPNFDLVVRCSTEDCGALGNEIRSALRTGNPNIPQFAMRPVTDILAQISAPRRFQIWLLGVFSILAICLATVGIYGLLSYLVSQRKREIGIRIALGANRRDLLRLIVLSGLKLAGIGIGIGLGASFIALRLMRHLLFGVTPTDPLTVVVVSLTLLTTAFTASYFPARLAAQMDPMNAIRQD